MKFTQLQKNTKRNTSINSKKSARFLMKILHILKSLRIAIYFLFSWRKGKKVDVSKYISNTNNENSKQIYLHNKSSITLGNSNLQSKKKLSDKHKPLKKVKQVKTTKTESSPQLSKKHESLEKVEQVKTTKNESSPHRVREPDNTQNLQNNLKTVHRQQVKINPKTVFVRPEEEKRSQIKFIGYEPNEHFSQSTPINYPYVIMPRPRSIIKFPRKNKVGNKGFTEEHFIEFIKQYFKSYFKVYTDRILIITSKQNPYEPDIALIDENEDVNLFIDIEIDEPYDGITREPMHFTGYDNERNKFFRNRGWLTIRFAEEQVWKNPKGCCKFLFNVIASLSGKYKIPPELYMTESIEFIPQWTVEHALEWAEIKYRELYLGIDGFNIQSTHNELEIISESQIEREVEEHVDENEISINIKPQNIKSAIIMQAINTGKYISCKNVSDSVYTILRPKTFNDEVLICDCYVKNTRRELEVKNLTDLVIRDQPFSVRLNGEIGIDEIKRVVRDAIQNHKLIRMKYTRTSWTEQIIDEETGEIILNQTESEQSLRTISDINYSVNVLSQEHITQFNLTEEEHITAYCHKSNELRTFRFDRINEMEILNI